MKHTKSLVLSFFLYIMRVIFFNLTFTFSISVVLALLEEQNNPATGTWNDMRIALHGSALPEYEYGFRYHEGLGYRHLELPHRLKYIVPLPPSLTSPSVKKLGNIYKMVFFTF